MQDKPVNALSLGLAAAPGFTSDLLATHPATTLSLPLALPSRAEVIRRLNTTYLMAAREAAQDSIPYASVAFGVSRTFATWLATAQIEEVLNLAVMPACVFTLRLPERALEPAHLDRLGTTAEGAASRMAWHTVLAGLSQEAP